MISCWLSTLMSTSAASAHIHVYVSACAVLWVDDKRFLLSHVSQCYFNLYKVHQQIAVDQSSVNRNDTLGLLLSFILLCHRGPYN